MFQRNHLSIRFCHFFAFLLSAVLFSSVVVAEAPNPKQTETSKFDLQTYQLLSRVAYQIGKDYPTIPKGGITDSMKTANGRIEASIDKVMPVTGTITKDSESQEVSFNATFHWPESPTSKAEMSIPIIMVLSCADSVTGHVWSDFSRPKLRIHKGQPAVSGLSIGRRNSMAPGRYLLTAMVFVKRSPESPLALLDIKQTDFIVESENAKQKQTKIIQNDQRTCQILARVAYQIGCNKFSLPKDESSDFPLSAYNQVKYSIKLIPAPGTKAKVSQALPVSCQVDFDWVDFPLVQKDLEIPVTLMVSWENSESGHLWTTCSRSLIRMDQDQRAATQMNMTFELNSARFGTWVPAGRYRKTAILFVKHPLEKVPSLVGIKQTKFVIEPEPEGERTQDQQKRDEMKDKQ